MKKIAKAVFSFSLALILSGLPCFLGCSKEHEHNLVSKEIQAVTCTQDGKVQTYCTKCDFSETKTVPARGHEFGEWYETKPATCLEEGELYKNCKNCSFFDTRMIPVTDHVFNNIEIIQDPTCTQNGIGIGYCACGEEGGEVVVEATGHSYENGECINCGETEN